MSSESDRGFLNTLKCKFGKLSIKKSPSAEDICNSTSNKTVADYIHENEIRLKTRRLTQNMSKFETIPSSYVFEKVKHETIPQFVKSGAHGSYERHEIDRSPAEYMLESFPIEIRPRTFSMPTQNTYTKPAKRNIQRSHLNINIEKPSYVESKPKEDTCLKLKADLSGIDKFFEQEMRSRTSSMPTRSLIKKPRIQHLRRSQQNLFSRPELEMHIVRSFELSNKGKIVKRSESRSTRSSNSELSLEDDLSLPKNMSRMSSVDVTGRYRVLVRGTDAVGKTALMQQFLTTQYLGGFDTTSGK